MYGQFNPYQYYNPQTNNDMLDKKIENANKQIEDLNKLKKEYTQPVNNFINTHNQIPNNMFMWRVLNENEEVDNLFVDRTTLFVGDNIMVLKDVNGKLEKWEINKIYPIDKKDKKINELEEELKKLKEMIGDELDSNTKSIAKSKKPTNYVTKSNNE